MATFLTEGWFEGNLPIHIWLLRAIRCLPKQFGFAGIIHAALVSAHSASWDRQCKAERGLQVSNSLLFCVTGNGIEHSELTRPLTMGPALSICRILTETTLPYAHPVLLMLCSFLYRFSDRNEVHKEHEPWFFWRHTEPRIFSSVRSPGITFIIFLVTISIPSSF